LNIVHRDFGNGPRQLIDFAIKETGEALKPSGNYVRNKDREEKKEEGVDPASLAKEVAGKLTEEQPPF